MIIHFVCLSSIDNHHLCVGANISNKTYTMIICTGNQVIAVHQL